MIGAFVGRRAELREIGELFGRGERLVTVVGAAGMGKTSLARRFLETGGAGGGVFVGLEGARSAEDVVRAVAAAAGAGAGGGAVSGEEVGEVLAGRAGRAGGAGGLLLVLDNLEQVLDGAAGWIGAWLGAAPQLRVLATSREALRIEGEVVLPLGPLAVDGELAESEAAALFLERARAARPDLVPQGEALRAVGELVRRLDGIPLAIELAAARISLLSPAEILGRLDAPLALLRGRRRDQGGRQATVEGAVQWSWELLGAAERSVLSQASVFSGSFDFGAAQAVVRVSAAGGAEPPDLLELLQSLVERSLIRVDRERRMSLFLVIRAFAAERLTTQERRAVRERHARWAVATGAELARGFHGAAGAEARAGLGAMESELVAVVEGASGQAPDALAALHPLWVTRGPLQRYAQWLVRVGEGLEPGARSARRRLHLGALRRVQGRLPEAVAELTAAAEEARAHGALAELAEAQAELGISEHERGDLAAAERWQRLALAGFEALGDRRGEGRVLGSLAIGLHERGEADEAVAGYEAALRQLRAAGDERSVGIFLSNLGDLHLEQGRLRAARDHYERARAALRQVGDLRIAAVVTGNLGAVLQDEGDLDAAARARQEAAEALGLLGDRRMEAIFTGYVGAARHALGALDEALPCYESAAARLTEAGDRRFATLFTAHQGAAALAGGDADAGRRLLKAAAAAAAELADPEVLAVIRCHWGQVAVAEGQTEEARRILAEAQADAGHDDLRFSARLLQAAIDPDSRPWRPEGARALLTRADGGALTSPEGARVDLSRKPTLRRVAAALLVARREHPGLPLGVEELLSAGWPGETPVGGSGANRVYVAIASLRKLGLRSVLLSQDEGYLLDPAIPLQTADVA